MRELSPADRVQLEIFARKFLPAHLTKFDREAALEQLIEAIGQAITDVLGGFEP
jgi:hypothetical protein